MADDAHTLDAGQSTLPLTPDAFIADRQRFWTRFTQFVVSCAVVVVVVLLLMALFLL